MRSVNNKHNEFAESLRNNIMRTEEKKQSETQRKSDEEYDEETQSLQELWAKIEELFAPIDDNDD